MSNKLKAVLANYPNRKEIIKAVVAQLGDDDLDITLNDVSHGGAEAGWSGFTYYKETCEFYQVNKDHIWDMAMEQAEELGCKNVFEMIAGFGGAKNVGSCDQFENLMAWYALEEVANMFANTEAEEVEEEEEN